MVAVSVPSEVVSAAFRRAFHSVQASGSAQSYLGPSSFETPESIEAVAVAHGPLSFRFVYPDSEAADPTLHVLDPEKSVGVRLGEHSKRIFEVVLLGDVDARLSRPLNIATPALFALEPRGSNRDTNAFRMNAEMVAAILNSMPKQWIDELRARLHDMR